MKSKLAAVVIAALLLLAAVLYLLLYPNLVFGVAQIEVNGVKYNAYVANTPEERTLGLMGRLSIGDCAGYGDCAGMLFVFPNDSRQCFWMKGTQIPLEQYWIENGTITSEAYGAPYSLNVTCHRGSIVLETIANSSVFAGQSFVLIRYLT